MGIEDIALRLAARYDTSHDIPTVGGAASASSRPPIQRNQNYTCRVLGREEKGRESRGKTLSLSSKVTVISS